MPTPSRTSAKTKTINQLLLKIAKARFHIVPIKTIPKHVYISKDLESMAKKSWMFLISERNPQAFKSSWFVCISKKTGKILYEGSANDEG
jgi:hypothetical protein